MSLPNVPPMCLMCKHWQPGALDDLNVNRCKAFPEGIPKIIFDGGFDHRQPLENEHTLFEPADGVTPEDVAEWEKARQQQATEASRRLMGIPRETFYGDPVD